MIKKILQMIRALADQGVNRGMRADEVTSTRLVNGVSWVLCFTTLPFLFFEMANRQWGAVAVIVVATAVYGSFVALNRLGYRGVARWGTILFSNAVFVGVTLWRGRAMNMEMSLFITACLPILLFDIRREKLQQFAAVLVAVVAYLVLEGVSVDPDFSQSAVHLRANRVVVGAASLLELVAMFWFLRVVNDRSEQDLGRAIQDLRESQAKLVNSARMSTLGEMASGVAHEINNPLAVLSLQAEALIEKIGDGSISRDEATDGLRKIQKTATRISRIDAGLRHFSRDSENDPSDEIQIKIVIEETLEFCLERFRRQGVRLKVHEVSENIVVRCRAPQISQVLLNLLNNAFDAVSRQPVREVEVKVVELPSEVEIQVSDNGPGVPEDLRNRIFVPFFTTKRVGEGTGLGLSVSLGIMQRHRGGVRLLEQPGRTTFVMSLPKKGAKIGN